MQNIQLFHDPPLLGSLISTGNPYQLRQCTDLKICIFSFSTNFDFCITCVRVNFSSVDSASQLTDAITLLSIASAFDTLPETESLVPEVYLEHLCVGVLNSLFCESIQALMN